MKKVLFCLGVLRIVANTDAMLNVWSVSRDQKQAKMEQSGELQIVTAASVLPVINELENRLLTREEQNDNSTLTIDLVPTGGVGAFSLTLAQDVCMVVVPDNVRVLPAGCFQANTNLRRVTFGPSAQLERIGEMAFYMTHIEGITIPYNVRELCKGCFAKCTHLKRVTFAPDALLEYIRECAFSETDLEEIDIPDNVVELGNRCFENCKSLCRTKFGTNSRLTYIKEYAFAATPITEIFIPDTVQELYAACFSGCYYLTNVAFGPSCQLRRIRKKAFENTGIQMILVPNTVDALDDLCFCNCLELTHFRYSPRSSSIKIGQDIFCGSCKLQKIEITQAIIPRIKNDIYADITDRCIAFTVSIIPLDATFDDRLLFPSNSIEHVTIPANLTRIEMACFTQHMHLTQVDFEQNSQLSIIETAAFREINLQKIIIPSTVIEIGSACFYGCQNLSEVIFASPSQLRFIGKGAFALTNIANFQLPSTVESIGMCCFAGCQSLSSFIFEPQSRLRSIPEKTFQACSQLREILIPRSITNIDNSCFHFCLALSKVEIEANSQLECIGEWAFWDTPVNIMRIPDSVVKIGTCCFYRGNLFFSQNSRLDAIGSITPFGNAKIYDLPVETVQELRISPANLSDQYFHTRFRYLKNIIYKIKYCISSIWNSTI